MAAECLHIVRRDIRDEDLAPLLAEALTELRARYGPQVTSSVFSNAEYYLALLDEEAAGCGALQRVDATLFEIKRMYVPGRLRGRGVARAILACLEERAKALGATRIRLQTGTRQPEAVSLYMQAGYQPDAPWGRYASDPNSLCFSKGLS